MQDKEDRCLVCGESRTWTKIAVYVRGKPDYRSGYRWIRIPKVYVCTQCHRDLEAHEKRRQDERKLAKAKRRRD